MSTKSEYFSKIRSKIIAMVQKGEIPSMAVAVAQEGRISWKEAFGWATLDNEAKATLNTIYPIASLSKSLTATGIMVLVEQEKVELDDPVEEYIAPSELTVYEGKASEVTVRRILNMTSGVPHGYMVHEANLSTFHFFFEPYTLLRIRAEEDLVTQQVKPYIERKLSELHANNPSVNVDPSYTEEPSYGEGWQIAQKMFEFGGKSAILKSESDIGNVQLGSDFNEGKFMHLLLNQWGHSLQQEALLHFKIVGERFAVIHSGTNIDLVREKLPQILTQLESRFFSQIEDLVRNAMTES